MSKTKKKMGTKHLVEYWTGRALSEEHKRNVSKGRTGVTLSKKAHHNLSRAAKKREFDKKIKEGKFIQLRLV